MNNILLTGLGPISNKIASHKAAQAIIYADQIKEAGNTIDINLVSNKITDFSLPWKVWMVPTSMPRCPFSLK